MAAMATTGPATAPAIHAGGALEAGLDALVADGCDEVELGEDGDVGDAVNPLEVVVVSSANLLYRVLASQASVHMYCTYDNWAVGVVSGPAGGAWS